MKRTKAFLIIASAALAGLAATSYAWATPSSTFHEQNNEVSDDWGIFRTRGFGEDGFYQLSETSFRPVIAFESLGDEADQAYELGQEAAVKYPDRIQCAEAIFSFVRDRVQYTTDIDQFGYDEFAQNADEMAVSLNDTGLGYGDCEDSAVLLAVMYKGAGFRSAIAVGKGHTASLVYLPEYDKATSVFEIDGEAGWLWCEATGSSNPLGWVPREFINTETVVYEIGDESVSSNEPPDTPSTAFAPGSDGTISAPSPFLIIVGFLIFTSLIRRSRRRAR